MIGHTISHYQIVEKLGGGGMGVVYKAVDVRLNRFVALKFLSSALTADAEANERFIQEAQAASALDHPNICTIYEIDETPTRELFLTMAYYDGDTLKQRLDRGSLPPAEALDIAIQVAQALARAHESGIVHRDIKPANLMIARDRLVKILDFGLAKLAGHGDLTRTGTTLGTIAYMSPEQIRGIDIGPQADVWALGVVLYEMVAGRRPFDGKDDLAVVSSIANDSPPPISSFRSDSPAQLQRIVSRAMHRNLQARYTSAVELLTDLVACRAAMTEPVSRGADVGRLLRRPAVAIPAVIVLVMAAVPATRAYQRGARETWARNVGIPQIMQLAANDDHAGAFAIAKQVEQYIPNDPVLATLWPLFSRVGALVTDPPEADAYVQPYSGAGDQWEHLGRTPITNVRLPRGAFRFRIEKAGYEPQLLATTNPGPLFGNAFSGANTRGLSPEALTIALRPTGDSAEMVWVPGGAFPVGLTGFNSDQSVSVDAFLVDRHEVTNGDFKRFVDRGGYVTRDHWRELPSPDLVAQFVDSTSRHGPSTWELGAYSSGQAEHPVGGVSWYEAVAYCHSIGKTLPSLFHWARAAVAPVELGWPLSPVITPLSNFSGKGVAAVGTYRGLGPYGTYDMAGNVREWVWNEAENGRRWIPGGAANDPDYFFVVPNSLPALDRSDKNGFRCARYAADTRVSDQLLARVDMQRTDARPAKPVSNEVFEVFKRQYAYVKSPLNDGVESKDVSGADWVREKITFDAGYENGRATAYLFLPKNAAPPYQLVVFFQGLSSFIGRGTSENLQLGEVDFVVKSGRALVWPIYKGSFERWDSFLSLQGEEYLRSFRTRMFQWRQDVGRVLEILAARSDIDSQRIAYYGSSFGASTAVPLVALEERFKVAILRTPGFTYRVMPAEADAINYVSHVTIPVLMLGGRYDYTLPLETAQKPMFEGLGTPAEHKRHVVFEAGHANFPRSAVIREVLGWLDRYLGPVTITARAGT